VTISLKIEILKVFSLEFDFSSNKELPKKEKKDEKESAPASAPDKQPSKS
jgi:hypothetical protein